MTTPRLRGRPCSGRPQAKSAVSSRLHSFIHSPQAALSPGWPHFLQLREILFAKLRAPQRVAAIIVVLEPAQLHAADFSRNRLRQLGHEFDLPDALERREP